MTWYIQRGAENVKVYDRFDASGYSNIRFSGTIEAALTQFAAVMQECDELRVKLAAAEEEIGRLKTQAMR